MEPYYSGSIASNPFANKTEGFAPSAMPADTPMMSIARTFEMAREVVKRINMLADRVVGPVPEVDGKASAGIGGGLLGEIIADGDRTRAALAECNRAMARLEQALS